MAIYKVFFKFDGKPSSILVRANTAEEALRIAKSGMTIKRYSSFSVRKTSRKTLF